MVEAAQGPGLNLEADHMVWVRMGVDGEVVESVQARQTEAGERGQFTVGDGEVLELAQVTQRVVVKPGHVVHEVRARDAQRHGALARDHAEVGLVVLGINCSETRTVDYISKVSLLRRTRSSSMDLHIPKITL